MKKSQKASLALSVLTLVSLSLAAAAGPGQEPSDGRFFDSDGTRIHYIDRGSGETVLLIHGLSMDLELNWVQPGIVAAVADAGYRVVAYDNRGHGRSDKPRDPASYGPVEMEDAIRLLDHLGIDRAHVVGYSRGGFLANRLRARYPERFASVILGGYGNAGGKRGAVPEERRAETAAILEAGDFRGLVRMVVPEAPTEEVEAWAALLRERNDGRALAAAVRSEGSWPVVSESQLRDNRVPTLALIGDLDQFHDEVLRMRDTMANLEALVLPGATHGTTLGRPELVTAILGFLRKHPVSAEPGHDLLP